MEVPERASVRIFLMREWPVESYGGVDFCCQETLAEAFPFRRTGSVAAIQFGKMERWDGRLPSLGSAQCMKRWA